MRVLELFLEDPTRQFTLGVVGREAGLSSATCLGILNEFVLHGYLVRDPATARFAIGPALVALGRTAADYSPMLVAIYRHVEQLAADLNADCGVTCVDHDQVVILDLVTRPLNRRDPSIRSASGVPFRAPSGLSNIIWDSDDSIREWMARDSGASSPEDLQAIWDTVDVCRRVGYFVRGLMPSDHVVSTLFRQAAAGVPWVELQRPLHEALLHNHAEHLRASTDVTNGTVDVSSICVPIYNERFEPEFVIFAQIMRQAMPRAHVERVGTHLVETAKEIMTAVGTRPIEFEPAELRARWKRSVGGPRRQRRIRT